jgi:hypothetical protein
MFIIKKLLYIIDCCFNTEDHQRNIIFDKQMKEHIKSEKMSETWVIYIY